MEIILIITGWVLAAFFAGWIAHDIFGRSVKKDLASLADKIDKSNNNNDDFID